MSNYLPKKLKLFLTIFVNRVMSLIFELGGIMKITIIIMFLVFSVSLLGRGFLIPKEDKYTPLKVKYHRVQVNIFDGASETTIKQTFINDYNTDLEGIYLFPLPEGANVSKFKMKMKGEWVEGKVLEKSEARNIYDRIVRQMKDPGLIEYAGNNMFKASVYPIPKKGEMEIEITFTQILPLTGNIYSYTYPLKGGSTFSSSTKEDFTFTAKISSSIPIKSIYSPTHKIDTFLKGNDATTGFESMKENLDKDIKLFYTVSKEDIGASILSYKPEDVKEKGYFMIMLAPKSEVDDKEIENKNLLLVVDTSGSMAGDKIVYAKKSLQYVVNRLNPKDKFNIIRFSSGVEAFKKESIIANDENKKEALKYIDNIYASGGTAIDEALQEALKKLDKDLTNLIVFITDGKPTVGETETKEIIKNVSKYNTGNAKIFTFGIGDDLNAVLVDKIAEKNHGSSDYMKDGSETEVILSSFYDKVAFPVLINPSIEIKNVQTFDIYPHKMPDLFKGQQLYILGRFDGDKKSALIKLTGEKKGISKTYDFEVDFNPLTTNDFIPHIWATKKVGFLLEEIRLNGENKELVDEATKLAKEFGIVTPYTSYLVTEKDKNTETVNDRTIQGGSGNGRLGGFMGTGSGGGGSGIGSRGDLKRSEAKSDPGKSVAMKGFNEESGLDAVTTSKSLNKMKQTTTISSSDDKKIVGEKTFILNNNIYVDTKLQSAKITKTIKVKYLSDNYYKLLKNSKLKKYLTISENIDIFFNGYKIEVRTETKEDSIPSDL